MLWDLKQPALFTPHPRRSLDNSFPPQPPLLGVDHRPQAGNLSERNLIIFIQMTFFAKTIQGSLYLGKLPPLPTGRRHNGEGAATLDLILICKAEPQVVALTISKQIGHGEVSDRRTSRTIPSLSGGEGGGEQVGNLIHRLLQLSDLAKDQRENSEHAIPISPLTISRFQKGH